MTSLRDIWINMGMDSHQAADKAGISIGTLYSANRKENVKVYTVYAICDALGITLEQYRALDRCPDADLYRSKK